MQQVIQNKPFFSCYVDADWRETGDVVLNYRRESSQHELDAVDSSHDVSKTRNWKTGSSEIHLSPWSLEMSDSKTEQDVRSILCHLFLHYTEELRNKKT